MKYSQELKAKVVGRMMAPGNEAIGELSKEFNVTVATLYNWRKEALQSGVVAPGDGQGCGELVGVSEVCGGTGNGVFGGGGVVGVLPKQRAVC